LCPRRYWVSFPAMFENKYVSDLTSLQQVDELSTGMSVFLFDPIFIKRD